MKNKNPLKRKNCIFIVQVDNFSSAPRTLQDLFNKFYKILTTMAWGDKSDHIVEIVSQYIANPSNFISLHIFGWLEMNFKIYIYL